MQKFGEVFLKRYILHTMHNVNVKPVPWISSGKSEIGFEGHESLVFHTADWVLGSKLGHSSHWLWGPQLQPK